MLWHPKTLLQKPCKIAMYNVFLPESYQNDPKFHFNTLLRSDTQKSSKNVENTTVFWSRCDFWGLVSVRNRFWAPPPSYNVFFIFGRFCHCRNTLLRSDTQKSSKNVENTTVWFFLATKMTQNSISIPSCAQTPKNPRKMSKTPPNSRLGAKPFLAPPPAKADIATAILTNVIEHLV